MTNFVDFGSIEQFASMCKNIKHMSKYVGQDENGQAVYNHTLKAPVLEVIASEKIHGTSFGAGYTSANGIWFQSRNGIITPENDNAGSAFFATAREPMLKDIILQLAEEYSIDTKKNAIIIFGEFAGGNIQKKSAVTGLPKQLFLFQHFKVSPLEPEERIKGTYWKETKIGNNWMNSKENGIYNVMNFPTYALSIDFEEPKMYQNQLIKLVDEIEKNSPIGKQFGIDGNVGEGVVITAMFNGSLHRSKVKGEAHSSTTVKTLTPVDEEKEQRKINVATKVCPAWRLEQFYDLANDTINGGEASIKNIVTFLKMVVSDVIKEEMPLLIENELEIKDISGKISHIARGWYLEQVNGLD